MVNALVVGWREEHLIGLLYPLQSEVVPQAGGRGSPLLFVGPPKKFSAVECESGWSPLRLIVCVYSNSSVLQLRLSGTDKLHLRLNPSSESMHEMYMWV